MKPQSCGRRDFAWPFPARSFQVEEVIIRGQRCKRVDLGHSMRLAAVDVSAVPHAQARPFNLTGLCNAEMHGCLSRVPSIASGWHAVEGNPVL